MYLNVSLIQEWKFIRDDEPEAFARGYDDSAWKDVVVPHDWSVGFPFSKKNSSGTGYLPGGIGWYRAYFDASEDVKTALLTFDGVYKNAQIWVNGYYFGKRPNGYIGITHDISHCIRPKDNIVAVKVSHPDIGDSRWFTGSGIYRKVKLVTHCGAYIPSQSVIFTYDGEKVNIKACVEGELSTPVTVSLGDHKWTVENTNCIEISAKIDDPKLWSVEEPNLYDLSFKAGDIQLCETIRVGLRTFRFDADTGFYLNDKNMKLKGVCVHHDAGCLGAAVWSDVWRRRLEKLRTAGCNAIRTSHNPHMPELYDLCDEMGFIMMDEAFDEWEGCKNKWTTGHNVYPPVHQGYYEDFPDWHERDLADFIKIGRNHPSILMWSVGNEIDYPNDPYAHPLFDEMTGNNDANKPAQERIYNPDKPNMERLSTIAKRLAEIVRENDTTRPVLVAAAFPELSSHIGFFDPFDIIGYNYKEHLYAKDHERFPKLPILGSENGHGEDQWAAVRDNDYISGQFLWTGIDYLGEARGWPIRGSHAGILDVAGYEKPDRYYIRKTWWTGEESKAPETGDGAAAKIELSVWGKPSIQGAYKVYQIEVTVCDSSGKRCAESAAQLHYGVRNGKLLGIESGNLSDLTAYSESFRCVHNGRAIAFILVKENDQASLCVTSEGLPDACIEL